VANLVTISGAPMIRITLYGRITSDLRVESDVGGSEVTIFKVLWRILPGCTEGTSSTSEDSRSPCVNLNSWSLEFKPRVLRILSQYEVTIFEISFHFCVKVTSASRLANSSNLTELKYSELPIACISTVTINRKARLKETNLHFTPRHYGLG